MPLTRTKDILDAAQDWINWGKQFGWACYGCDDHDSGSFHRNIELRGIPFTITRAMRDDIDRVINSRT